MMAMGWVTEATTQLKAGHAIQVRPSGGSMRGRIESGQLTTISPVDPADVKADDVVLVAWKENYLLHLVKEAAFAVSMISFKSVGPDFFTPATMRWSLALVAPT